MEKNAKLNSDHIKNFSLTKCATHIFWNGFDTLCQNSVVWLFVSRKGKQIQLWVLSNSNINFGFLLLRLYHIQNGCIGSASEVIDSLNVTEDNIVYHYSPSATEDIGSVSEDVFQKIVI